MPGGESGNGWVTCALGHQHWGRFGAAGLLAYVADPACEARSALVLVQRRSRWAHQGGTWALPGGAMDSDETPAEAALREADEECMLDPKLVVPRGRYSDEHGGGPTTPCWRRPPSRCGSAPMPTSPMRRCGCRRRG